jgi:SAM-dependent methyltransferase
MPGFVEEISERRVKGWAYDPARKAPATVRVVLHEAVIAECLADIPRNDVAKALKSSGLHGFDLRIGAKIAPADLPKVKVLSSSGPDWEPLEVIKSDPNATRSYQDFDGEGTSRSHEKLASLRLHYLPRADRDAPPLRGKAVLDLGCNEGFFCIEAVRQGATRVVGIDRKQELIESARRRCPDATFIRGTWWDIPNERFDCIFFLSAIHYEPQQRKLLRKLVDHLTPTGVLVLECGVIRNIVARAWCTVKRSDGVRRYPTQQLLMRDLLADYAVRPAGQSVKQKGDPVDRYVFHCTPHGPIAMIIAAPSLSGKTNLSFQLEKRDVPTYATDALITRLIKERGQQWRPIARKLSERFPRRKSPDLAQAALHIVENHLEDELCDIIVAEVPTEASIFCIQGDVLRHPTVLDALKQKLVARRIRPWLVNPL